MAAHPSGLSAALPSFGCKLPDSAICPIIMIISEDIKQHWPLEYTNSDWLPAELYAANHNPLSPAVQPVFSLPHCPLT